MIDMIDKLSILPVMSVGEITVARCNKTLDMALVFQSRMGPLIQRMSDEAAVSLGLALIRESGMRATRTEALFGNLQRALVAQIKETAHDETIPTLATSDSAGESSVSPNGGNGVGGGRKPSKYLSPCTPRGLGLTDESAGGSGDAGSAGGDPSEDNR